ncbi:hypothetical protein BDL97_05G127100 [Sphagnum fallax]|nr:hypothetical protein BDL97_05G127100 [Sphagnum fallax]
MNRNNVPQDVQTASIVQQPPGRGKQQRPASQPVDSHSVSRRLQAKLMSLMTCGVLGISAFPEGDNIFAWIGTIEGSKFLSAPCFIDSCTEGKKHCINVGFRIQFWIEDKWSSAYDVWTILLSIQSLLGEPNNDSPLNSYAAALWSDQKGTLKVLL